VPLVPRVLTEIAHRDTGIGIHRAAHRRVARHRPRHGHRHRRNRRARRVKLYQGVTRLMKSPGSKPIVQHGLPNLRSPRKPLVPVGRT
jgi:hypothetical protein